MARAAAPHPPPVALLSVRVTGPDVPPLLPGLPCTQLWVALQLKPLCLLSRARWASSLASEHPSSPTHHILHTSTAQGAQVSVGLSFPGGLDLAHPHSHPSSAFSGQVTGVCRLLAGHCGLGLGITASSPEPPLPSSCSLTFHPPSSLLRRACLLNPCRR